jgi:hypothetical protein
MNWRIDRACSFAIHMDGRGNMSVVKVCLVASLLERFGIGLCLLSEKLIENLDLIEADGAQVLRLMRADQITSIQHEKGKIILTLDETELERWRHFALRTVRDGIAEVDHFDVDAAVKGRMAETISVVVAFPSAMPPVSADEARRRLGL